MPYLQLLRPKQWTKGLIVFAAILFTDPFHNVSGWIASLFAFLAFGLVSAATYIGNDIIDVEKDRQHPKKKFRPIASGSVPIPQAIMVGIVLVCAAAGVLTRLPQMATVIIAIYVTIQILYNVRLKAEPIADVFCLSSGFVLRAAIGAAAMNVAITYWLLYCTFCLALMLGFGKRRGELLTLGDQANSIRASLGEYTPKFLDFAMLISATAALLGYGVYCIESPTAQKHPLLVVTFLWVGYAVFRYLHVVLQSSEGGEPEVLFLEDRPLQLAVLLFIVTTGIAMFAGAAA